jgi:hypothetical protein
MEPFGNAIVWDSTSGSLQSRGFRDCLQMFWPRGGKTAVTGLQALYVCNN